MAASGTTISGDALAEAAMVSREKIGRFTESGLLQQLDDGGYAPTDTGRVRIIEELTSKGVPLEALAAAVRDGAVSLSWFGGILPPPSGLEDETYEELFDRTGLGTGLAITLFEVWGVAMPPLTARVREDDARLVDYLASFKSQVQDDDAVVVEATRYFGDSARRDAESQIAFFRRRLFDPLLDAGATLKDVIESVNPLVDEIIRPGAQELMLWLHRRHIDALNMQMLVETVQTALEEAGVAFPRSENLPAIVFMDMSGFTSQTEREGDDTAAELAVRFSDIVRAETAHMYGSVVKFLGDGVMLHFSDAEAATNCAVRIIEQLGLQDLPPAHAGLDVGNLVFRDGDYFGRTVNVAARIADYARPGEVLISDAAARHLQERTSIELRPVGPVALKGVVGSVPLHTVMAI